MQTKDNENTKRYILQKAKWETFENIPLTKEIEETRNKQELDDKITKFHEVKEICEKCIAKSEINTLLE